MGHGTKFTRSQLRERGFVESSTGTWRKDGVSNDDSKVSGAKLESVDGTAEKKDAEDEEAGERGVSKGVRYRLIVRSYRGTLIDPSNLCIKAIEDQMTEHGLIPDDGWKDCDQPLFFQYQVPRREERTVVELLRYEVGGKDL